MSEILPADSLRCCGWTCGRPSLVGNQATLASFEFHHGTTVGATRFWRGASHWCNVVHQTQGNAMPAKTKPAAKVSSPSTYRTSVSFPAEHYRALEEIAKQKKVSVAWVIRDATEAYVSEQWPLLDRKG